MSSFLSQARARSLRPTVHLPRPRLTIVPKVAARAPRIPFVFLVVTVLAGGLVGLLLLNTALQRGAYAVTDLQRTSASLNLRQQNLEIEVASLQSPQRISERALRLGMVQNDSPAFLSLSTGKVIGVPVAGVAGNRPHIGVTAFSRHNHQTKIAPFVAGQGNSETTDVVKVRGTEVRGREQR
ncbi:MAG: hypothetical protein ABJA81_10820 [Nocardioidaceae bacterium]